LIDEPLSGFVLLPEFLQLDDNEQLSISGISDRLVSFCALRSIPVPTFIQTVESSFHSIDECAVILEFGQSIEQIHGFFQVRNLEVIRFSPGSQLREIQGFVGCEALRRIEFPLSVELIDGFIQCRSLQEVTFETPSRVRQLRGFYYCCSLVEIRIPESVEILSGFERCKKLERICFGLNCSILEIHGFGYCRALRELEVPVSVTSIQGFKKCRRLTAIAFTSPSRVKTLKGFQFCVSLCAIEIPASVAIIHGFQSSGVCKMTLDRGTRIERIPQLSSIDWDEYPPNRPLGIFIRYAKSDLQNRRRLVHTGLSLQECHPLPSH
jgi:hypothetical protein